MAKGRALLVGDDNQDVTPEDVVKVRVGQGHEKGVDACVGSRGAVVRVWVSVWVVYVY